MGIFKGEFTWLGIFRGQSSRGGNMLGAILQGAIFQGENFPSTEKDISRQK